MIIYSISNRRHRLSLAFPDSLTALLPTLWLMTSCIYCQFY